MDGANSSGKFNQLHYYLIYIKRKKITLITNEEIFLLLISLIVTCDSQRYVTTNLFSLNKKLYIKKYY